MTSIAPYPALGATTRAVLTLPLIWRSHAEREWRHVVTPDQPIEWRPGQGIDLKRTIAIDVVALAAELGIDIAPRLHCTFLWKSRQLQGIAATANIDCANAIVGFDLEGTAPGNLIADSVTVTTRITVATSMVGLAPAGSVLWEDETRIPLSGAAPALTIYSVPFAERGLPNASWCSVRLPIDIGEHPSAIEVLLNSGAGFDIEELLSSSGRGSEIATELVLIAISDAIINWSLEHADDLANLQLAPEDEETMGTVAIREIQQVFDGRSPVDVRTLRENEPGLYAALVQARRFGHRSLIEVARSIDQGIA